MERAGALTAVPGWGGVAMGFSAVVAAVIARQQRTHKSWLAVWLLEACVAFLIGLTAMWRKAHLRSMPLWSGPTRKFAFSFAPPLLAGAVFTAALVRSGMYSLLPGVWLCLYGVAVMTGGAFSTPVVPVMGSAFLATGAAALFLYTSSPNAWLAVGFGAMHMIFGLVIARKYGG